MTMTDALTLAGIVLVILLANAGFYAVVWKGIQDRIEPEPILVPNEDDTVTANDVIVARVRYDATGNQETFIIRDDGRSDWETKQAIQKQVAGADVQDVARKRLYSFGPGADVDD